jgi:demethylmenaquinone methyltransferase/2-methoxy-6-polyprenyl-1,4-benzoquinol methylase
MVALTAGISVAAGVVFSPAGRRRGRGPDAFRCSASSAGERQALFSRIAPVYDLVRTSALLSSPRCFYEISTADSNAMMCC